MYLLCAYFYAYFGGLYSFSYYCLFIALTNYLWSDYRVPGPEGIAVNKTDKNLCPSSRLSFSCGVVGTSQYSGF
jgi:hypothetical protein